MTDATAMPSTAAVGFGSSSSNIVGEFESIVEAWRRLGEALEEDDQPDNPEPLIALWTQVPSDQRHKLLNTVISEQQRDRILHKACAGGKLKCVQWLIGTARADKEAGNKEFHFPLYIACMHGRVEVAKYLLDAGADIEGFTKLGWRSIHIAALCNHEDVVRLLLQRGADRAAETREAHGSYPAHSTAADIAHAQANFAMEALLLDATSKWKRAVLQIAQLSTPDNPMPLQSLVSEVQDRHARGALVNLQLMEGNTALHLVCNTGKLDVARWLVSVGNAEVNQRNTMDRTPLWCACEQGHVAIVEYLLDSTDADIETVDRLGWRPLHVAAARNRAAIISTLLLSGAHREPRTKFEWEGYPANMTPEKIAKANHSLECIELLRLRPYELQIAAWQSAVLELTNSYVSDTPDSKPATPRGAPKTPRAFAARTAYKFDRTDKDIRVLEFLWKQTAVSDRPKMANNTITQDYETALHIACIHQRFTVVRWLVSYAVVNLECRDMNDRTPLHRACASGNTYIVRFLADAGAQIQAMDKCGWQPIHYAAYGGHAPVLRLLMQRGASKAIVTRDDQFGCRATSSVLDLAKQRFAETKSDNYMDVMLQLQQMSPASVANLGRALGSSRVDEAAAQLSFSMPGLVIDDVASVPSMGSVPTSSAGSMPSLAASIPSERSFLQVEIPKDATVSASSNTLVAAEPAPVPAEGSVQMSLPSAASARAFELAQLLEMHHQQEALREWTTQYLASIASAATLNDWQLACIELSQAAKNFRHSVPLVGPLLSSICALALLVHEDVLDLGATHDPMPAVTDAIKSLMLTLSALDMSRLKLTTGAVKLEWLIEDMTRLDMALTDRRRAGICAFLSPYRRFQTRVQALLAKLASTQHDLQSSIVPLVGDSVLQLNESRTDTKRLTLEQLQLQEPIMTSSGHTQVFKSYYNGMTVAVMVPPIMLEPDQTPSLRREAAILQRLRHPNVLAFHGLVIEQPHFGIVFELMQGGTLAASLFDESQEFGFEKRLLVATHVAAALESLHKNSFVHANLTSTAVLLDAPGNHVTRAVVATIGLKLTQIAVSSLGINNDHASCMWRAPETRDKASTFTKESDVWAFGVLLWELVVRKSLSDLQTCDVEDAMIPVPDAVECPKWYADLIAVCCDPTPSRRPSFEHHIRPTLQNGLSALAMRARKSSGLLRLPSNVSGRGSSQRSLSAQLSRAGTTGAP